MIINCYPLMRAYKDIFYCRYGGVNLATFIHTLTPAVKHIVNVTANYLIVGTQQHYRL